MSCIFIFVYYGQLYQIFTSVWDCDSNCFTTLTEMYRNNNLNDKAHNFVCIITKQRKYTLKISLFPSQVDNYQDLWPYYNMKRKKIPRISNKNTAWDNHSWFPKINPSRNLLHFKYRKKSGRRQFHASSTTISFFLTSLVGI